MYLDKVYNIVYYLAGDFMTNEEILIFCLNNEKYLTNTDLRMNSKYNILLNRDELFNFNRYKDEINNDFKVVLPLVSFNSKNLYYYKAKELVNTLADFASYFSDTFSINDAEVILSQMLSELEGTLKIEGVNTTRKEILTICNTGNIKNINDQIIFNMFKGYEFINKKPAFNKENIYKLYNTLSYKSLKETDVLKYYYRDGLVYVSNYEGCPVPLINEAMNSLIDFVNNSLAKDSILTSLIVHYYIVYIHPYFDFNGRMARMSSLWINNLYSDNPFFLSEAINDDKLNYYKAISNTRDSFNDLTYFLIYLLKLANKYYLLYKNLFNIESNFKANGEGLNQTEIYYLKRILINKDKGYFNYKDFLKYAGINITKQGALKILNAFCDLGLLASKINKKKEKVFLVNDEIISYKMCN